MLIDLGEKPKADVKVGASVYEMEVPSLLQSQNFREKMGADDANVFDLFIDFVVGLGMPKDVAEGLSVQQLTVLAEGLMGDPKKK